MPTVEVAQQVAFTSIFPITFVSNAFVPLAEPADVAAAGRRVEPDQHADRVAARAVGQPEPVPGTRRLRPQPILVTLIWFVVIVAVFAPLGVRRYRLMSR